LAVGGRRTPVRLVHYSDVENVHDDPERVARLAGLLTELDGDDALVCGTGDNTGPGFLPLTSRGGQAVDFWRAVEPDCSTFGNHAFDFGLERTAELVARSPQQWLSANVLVDGDPVAGVDPWTIRSVDGTAVGCFGLTDPTTPSGTDDAAALEFTDPIDAATRAADALRDRGAEVVVALSHLGRADDRLAAATDVDVVLGGHVHSERVERVADTLLTRPGDGGRVVLEVDRSADEVTRHPVAAGPIDDALRERYRQRLAETGLETVVGHVADPIERTERAAFGGESRAGNFVADAYRWVTERELGTDPPVVGLQNSGGLRTGPPIAGQVTVADLVSLVPFRESVAVADVPGRALRSVFREAADPIGFGKADWWHAHVSGATLEYDYADDALVEATVHGDPIDEAATYRLAVSEFLLETDAEFPTLSALEAVARFDTQYEVLADYARTVGIDPAVEGRITRRGL
jgi:2',3'-cyclic-nucleotide 2'-phosphodiesterase (5'-nucleotidase family)